MLREAESSGNSPLAGIAKTGDKFVAELAIENNTMMKNLSRRQMEFFPAVILFGCRGGCIAGGDLVQAENQVAFPAEQAAPELIERILHLEQLSGREFS